MENYNTLQTLQIVPEGFTIISGISIALKS